MTATGNSSKIQGDFEINLILSTLSMKGLFGALNDAFWTCRGKIINFHLFLPWVRHLLVRSLMWSP